MTPFFQYMASQNSQVFGVRISGLYIYELDEKTEVGRMQQAPPSQSTKKIVSGILPLFCPQNLFFLLCSQNRKIIGFD